MNPLSPRFLESGANSRSVCIPSLIFVLACLFVLVPPGQASAVATGSISVTNLSITSTHGIVVFGTPWTAQAFAQAQNSLCGCDSQFNSSVGGMAQADATVMFAQGHSAADASGLTLSASDGVNITGGVMAANAIGQGTLLNTFTITGGSGPVGVTFSALVNLSQSLSTDASGQFANADTSFLLSVDGLPVLSMASSNAIGSSSSWSNSFSGTLSDTVTLDFNQAYSLNGTVEDDPSTYNLPEPPSALLLLSGVALLVTQRVVKTFRY